MSLTGVVMLERQQELDRPLADVAGAPGGAGILLEAVRHGEVHDRVMGKPGEHRIERGYVGIGAGDPQAARDPCPVTGGALGHGTSSTARSYLAASRFAARRSVSEAATVKPSSLVGRVRIARWEQPPRD